MPAADHALLLFSHGSPDPEWARPLEALQMKLAERMAPMPVRLAFLPPAGPDFMTVVESLVNAGTRSLTVAPVFLARGGHVKKDLPELAAAAQARWGLGITLLPTLGESDLVLNVMAEWLQSQVTGR
ncbi:MAG: CbiX/SirB N-terminal domain-containing protein [Burkholderiales bacterium]|nr:CbiX/SirB N-terminal domain-containing protein [Burkholderiales bacterium]